MPGSKRWKTCGKGLHDLTNEANVRVKSDGSRQCRPCQADAKRAQADAVRGGPPEPRGIQRDDCSVEGCGRPRHRSTGSGRSRYCPTHLKRILRHGDAFEDVPVERTARSLTKRRAALGG